MKDLQVNGTHITATFDVGEFVNGLSHEQMRDFADSLACHGRVIEFVAQQIVDGATEQGSWGHERDLAVARGIILERLDEVKEFHRLSIGQARKDGLRDGIRLGMDECWGPTSDIEWTTGMKEARKKLLAKVIGD